MALLLWPPLLLLTLLPALVSAQTPPLTVTPSQLTLTGPVDGGSMATSLRLSASTPLTRVTIFASDLPDTTGDGRFRDAIPASAITVLPSPQLDTLAANSLTQVVIQVEPPTQAGAYSGALTIHWQEPEPGAVQIPLLVETRTQPNLVVQNPAQLSANAQQGQPLTRRITLKETVGGSSVTGLQALPQDLLTASGDSTILAQNMTVAVPPTIHGGQIATATVTINLANATAGAYSGSILFTTARGEVVTLPVNLNVKHHWLIPLLILAVGVAFGIWLTWYQEQGRPRDEVIVRLAAVRQAIADDPELSRENGAAQGFSQALAQHLTLAESELRSDDWPQARDAVAAAEDVLNRWRSLREAWLKPLRYLQNNIKPKLEQDDSNTLRKLALTADTLLQNAPTFATPIALQAEISRLEDDLLRYQYLVDLLGQVAGFRTNIDDAAKKEEVRQQENILQQRLHQLLPDNREAWTQLETDIQTLLKQAMQYAAPATAKSRSAAADVMIVPLTSNVPDISRIKPVTAAEGQRAAEQIKFFTHLAYLVGGLVLVWAGYALLYANNPTFGATPTDYLTVFTWGLGGQTAFATVANRLINWGAGRLEKQAQG